MRSKITQHMYWGGSKLKTIMTRRISIYGTHGNNVYSIIASAPTMKRNDVCGELDLVCLVAHDVLLSICKFGICKIETRSIDSTIQHVSDTQFILSHHLLSIRMLNEMEDDLETATENLNLVTRKTKELIQKSGGKRNFIIIVFLSVVMIILFFLVLYT